MSLASSWSTSASIFVPVTGGVSIFTHRQPSPQRHRSFSFPFARSQGSSILISGIRSIASHGWSRCIATQQQDRSVHHFLSMTLFTTDPFPSLWLLAIHCFVRKWLLPLLRSNLHTKYGLKMVPATNDNGVDTRPAPSTGRRGIPPTTYRPTGRRGFHYVSLRPSLYLIYSMVKNRPYALWLFCKRTSTPPQCLMPASIPSLGI
jgi:hypothetical protein